MALQPHESIIIIFNVEHSTENCYCGHAGWECYRQTRLNYIFEIFFLVAKFPLTCIPNLSKMPQDVTFTAWGLHAQMYVCMQALPVSFPPSQVYSIYTRTDTACSNICLSIETSDNILRYVTQMWNEHGILLPKSPILFHICTLPEDVYWSFDVAESSWAPLHSLLQHPHPSIVVCMDPQAVIYNNACCAIIWCGYNVIACLMG